MARAVTTWPARYRSDEDRLRDFARYADRETGRTLDLIAIVAATDPRKGGTTTSYAIFCDAEGKLDRVVQPGEIGRSIAVLPVTPVRERARAVLHAVRM